MNLFKFLKKHDEATVQKAIEERQEKYRKIIDNLNDRELLEQIGWWCFNRR